MKYQNSYIFIPLNLAKRNIPQKNDVIESKTLHNMSNSIYKTIKDYFNLTTSTRFKGQLNHRCGESTIQIDNCNISLEVEDIQLENSCFINVSAEGRTTNKCIQALEEFDSFIMSSNGTLSKKYVIIISYDAISDFYCNKIFKELSKFERSLRKLMFLIYIAHFVVQYYEKTLDVNIITKVKETMQVKDHLERLKMFFYNLDYNNIINILFSVHWTSYEDDLKRKIDNFKDLSKLPDDKLRTIISDLGPKSDWERLFKNAFPDNQIEQLIKNVQMQRNSIAHNKIFRKNNYLSCRKDLIKLDNLIDQAIQYTENVDFSERYKLYISELMKPISEVFSNLKSLMPSIMESMSGALGELQKTMSEFKNMFNSSSTLLLLKEYIVNEDEITKQASMKNENEDV